MLKLVIPAREWLDERDNTFISYDETTLLLEHSLLSLSKWESKWKKPYLDPKVKGKSPEEFIDYVRCMTINKGVDDRVYYNLTNDAIKRITDYINDPMTATKITKKNDRPTKPEIITSELIYYWMVSYGIPVEFEKWHLGRLMTLIDICAIKGGTDKKMSKNEILKQNASLNAMRRAQRHSKG